jgi:hypothetical protein
VVNGIKLRSALRLLLENVNQNHLEVVVHNGALWVTTKDQADQTLRTYLYDVAEITDNDPLQMEKLEEIVKNQTQGPWEENHGIGGVLYGPTPKLLACRQTLQMQEEVSAVLSAIRGSLKASGGDRSSITQYETRLETRFYRMDTEAAEDVASLIPALIEPGTWKWQLQQGSIPPPEELERQIGTIYQLAAGRMLLKLESGTVVESVEQHQQAAGTTTLPFENTSQPSPSQTGAAGAGTSDVVVIPQAVLIITHKPAVLRQVSKLLHSLLTGDGNWTSQGADGKVKFIAPGYQEGTWKGSLGSGVTPIGGFGGGGGFIGGGGGGFGGGGGGTGGGFFSIDSHHTP